MLAGTGGRHMLISGRDNPAVREYTRLRDSAAFRRERGRYVIEGARLCADALGSGVPVETAFVTAGADVRHSGLVQALASSGARVCAVDGAAAARLADTGTPQGIFCTAVMRGGSGIDAFDPAGRYVALERVQDPGNLGAVLRTAEALGFSGVILSGGCADIYSPKVLRGAMGAVFRIPFMLTGDLPGQLGLLTRCGIRTAAAVADRDAQSALTAGLGAGWAAVIGNEGAGLTQECVGACTARVTIPMPGRAQSLNAAAAAAILMWEMTRPQLTGEEEGAPRA
jgi:TrmH family RNA methyltransferase